MSEPSRPAPPALPTPTPRNPSPRNYVDFLLYLSAAVSYISLSIYNKWLLDWIIGPLWLVAWVWGLPAIVKLIRRQPVRPQRNPIEDNRTEDPE